MKALLFYLLLLSSQSDKSEELFKFFKFLPKLHVKQDDKSCTSNTKFKKKSKKIFFLTC